MKSKITIPSKIDEISTVYNWLESLIKDRVDMGVAQTILLVLQEITTNAGSSWKWFEGELICPQVEAIFFPRRGYFLDRFQDEGSRVGNQVSNQKGRLKRLGLFGATMAQG